MKIILIPKLHKKPISLNLETLVIVGLLSIFLVAFIAYQITIISVKKAESLELVRDMLSLLAKETRLEAGNISFDVHQSLDDPLTFVLWECFTDQNAFQNHLHSAHLKDFLSKDLVKFQTGIVTKSID